MLDELVNTIETLKARITDHAAVLRASEAQTRYSLIDPLLRALGWDTADPALVRPEYTVGGRRADYALLDAQGGVVVFLEAKSLGESLTNHRSQVAAYASELGIRYPALTNGSEWEVYDNSLLVPIEQRRVLDISLASEEDSAKCALRLLLLWNRNLASGQPVESNEPIVGLEQPPVAEPNPSHMPATVSGAMIAAEPGLVTLRDFGALPREIRNTFSVIRFPTGEERQMPRWVDLLIGVAEWLIRDGALTPSKTPIKDRVYPSIYLVNSQSQHSDGSEFSRHYKLSNGLSLYTWGQANVYIARCITLLEECGKDPATVHVKTR